MTISRMLWSTPTAILGVIGGFTCAIITTDCTVETVPVRSVAYVEAEPEPVYVETVPANIETYPRESYRGADVYLVGGQWYRHSGNRWQNYRTEPVELGRRRVEIERKAPHQAPEGRDERRERR